MGVQRNDQCVREKGIRKSNQGGRQRSHWSEVLVREKVRWRYPNSLGGRKAKVCHGGDVRQRWERMRIMGGTFLKKKSQWIKEKGPRDMLKSICKSNRKLRLRAI